VVALFAALMAAYFWFYKLAPKRHLADSKWIANHTEKARWIEEQRDYERMGSPPDLEFRGDRIGYYGDKRWFLWLADKAATDKNFLACGCSEAALGLMSNQHPDSWSEWMKANRNRTQEEWIRDGFSQYGVSVHLPPDAHDVEPLLKLIGRPTWNFLMGGPQGTNAPEDVPDYVQYNAFRWLRDSGFNRSEYVRSNATVAASRDMTIALLKYANWQSSFEFAQRDHLGVLAFAKEPENDQWRDLFENHAWFSRPSVIVAADSLIVALLLIGFWLVTVQRK
jgi:hypothetical protein